MSGTNFKEESTLHELREVSKEYAEAEAERQYLMEFRKSKKAILMGESAQVVRSLASHISAANLRVSYP